eukprot:scaffold152149_cov61-Attheya_sp.AAC.3
MTDAAAASVWVQLYYEGEENPVGNADPIEIKPIPNNVNDLKKKVYAEKSTKLNHVDAADLRVYASGTGVPVPEGLASLPANVIGSEAATGALYERPLIMVAPNPVQQNGEWRCCSRIHFIHVPSRIFSHAVIDFAVNEMQNKTVHKAMSDANETFAKELLSGYGVTRRVTSLTYEVGTREDPQPFAWTLGEHAGTPGARDWLQTHLLQANDLVGLKVVLGASLPTIKASQRSTSGKGDIAIGVLENMSHAEDEPYLFVQGLIELKSSRYPLKLGQHMLELMALSIASTFEKGVALLATDCNKKWNVFHFSDAVTIERKIYVHGRKALEDFMQMIRTADERAPTLVAMPALATHNEDQDMEGFDFPYREQKKMRATEDHARLERLADHLGDIYGERPVVPLSARAEARCPDYYV